MTASRNTVYLFSFLLAFCSLFYELVYAHILSVCLGGTKTQYLLIISLFTCALGLGSLLQDSFRKKYDLRKLFFMVELLLIVLGSAGPFVIAWLLQVKEEVHSITVVKIFFSYFLVFTIGLLSGFEIPCLFNLCDDSHGKVLAFDYGGMLVASVLFPFLFLPYLGAAASTLIIASLNLHALVWLLPQEVTPRQKFFFHLGVVALIVSLAFLKYELNSFLGLLYLGES